MDFNGLREAIRKEPFEPFVIRLADGRAIPIRHPDEASVCDPDEIRKRLDVIRVLPLLEVTESVESLAQAIVASGVIPPRAARDAAHIAAAAVHGMDYLLTWNCRHLANAQIMRIIEEVCSQSSERMPLICTPELLMGN